MKKIIIGIAAIVGLVASIMGLALASGSASAQTSSLTLTNITERVDNQALDRQTVNVGVQTVNDCNPGNRAFIGRSTLRPSAADVTGVLSQNCNWEITFSNVTNDCQVSAQVKGFDGSSIGAPETDGALILSGVGGNGPLKYQGQDAGAIDFAVVITDPTCSQTFTPSVSINVPGPQYAGFRFPVEFAPVADAHAGCSDSSTTTAAINDNGNSVIASDTTPARLISRPLGTTADCAYDVSFPSEVGSLRIQSRSATTSGPTERVTSASSVASAAYQPVSVQINVISTYPTDEVFDTNDKVDYFISVLPPCGGYVGILPAGFGTQGDVASVQVFPGSVIVYGTALDPIVIGSRTYTVQAFADVAGTEPCSVQVTEANGPEHCSPVGGPEKTETYAEGVSAFTFEFTHVCRTPEPQVGTTTLPPVLDPEPDTSEMDGSDTIAPDITAPKLPSVSETDTNTPQITGPRPEGTTG